MLSVINEIFPLHFNPPHRIDTEDIFAPCRMTCRASLNIGLLSVFCNGPRTTGLEKQFFGKVLFKNQGFPAYASLQTGS
jgi:hypothetical protein